MNKNDSAFILNWAKKIKSIEFLGGKCSICGETNPLVLTFHHDKNKNFRIRQQIRWSFLKKELENCIVLCSNCHSELHRKISRNGDIKENLLKDLKITKCSICGYSGKNFASLIFHHIDRDNKKFIVNEFISRKINGLTVEDLLEEISKCIVICTNCHRKQHSDSRFEKFKKEIYIKSKEYKEESLPLNELEIKKMVESGMKQIEICRKMNSPKSTISTIIKRLTNKNLLPLKIKTNNETKCSICGRNFLKIKKNKKFCSSQCYNKSRLKRPDMKVISDLLLKFSMKEIGEQFGVSKVSVWKWCKFYGI